MCTRAAYELCPGTNAKRNELASNITKTLWIILGILTFAVELNGMQYISLLLHGLNDYGQVI